MKWDINKYRELHPQVIGESNKVYKQRCFENFIGDLKMTLDNIRDFNEVDWFIEADNKKKLGKIVIEMKIK